jgi:hypothetical protein
LFYLLSNPLPAQIASSGSFKIESVEEAWKPDTDKVDISEFVVSTKDPQRKELLDEHPNTTHVSFHVSPDQKWIYESLSYGSRMNGAQLFECEDGLKFEPLQRDFEEAVWEFFGKEEKIEKSRVPYFAGDSHEGIIDFVGGAAIPTAYFLHSAWATSMGSVTVVFISGISTLTPKPEGLN